MKLKQMSSRDSKAKQLERAKKFLEVKRRRFGCSHPLWLTEVRSPADKQNQGKHQKHPQHLIYSGRKRLVVVPLHFSVLSSSLTAVKT